MSRLAFTIDREASGSQARAARFQTLHGEVQTPVFMPVGTQATVKSQTVETLRETGSSVLLANTYHLMLRPGQQVFEKLGGIHRFMNWDGPVLTDSGGFQIFSLPSERAMNEDGAHFQSYVDGTTYLLSPESSIAMQRAIGSDIMMVLDQCIPSTAGYDEAKAAMELTHRWAVRSLHARGDSPQAMFGIVQGACHQDLRKQSADFLRNLPFDGLAIGGLAVGETHAQRYEFTGLVTRELPKNLPRYLMGVGTPIDILEAVNLGVDMFDCIIPLQLAQYGDAFTSVGKVKLRRACYKFDETPLDPNCRCRTCRDYSRAYVHHLIKSDEQLGWHLIGIHNLAFYHGLMRDMRASILRDDFAAFYQRMRIELVRSDEVNPCLIPVTKPYRHPHLRDYEIVQSPEGYNSIRQISSGEIMHSVSSPTEEANRLYIDQSSLATRLLKNPAHTTHEPIVIWDVGLGAASNAMAAIHCFEAQLKTHGPDALRPLRIVSFEIDLDPLRLAAKHGTRFPHLHHSAPTQLLKNGSWSHASQLLQWELLEGDFLAHLEAATIPSLIFYDPFSYKTDSLLWTPAVFARIAQRCTGHSTTLYTYSASTAVRVALLSAGFYVAEGIGTGPKSTTTLAFTLAPDSTAPHPNAAQLLSADWLTRWHRSTSKFPTQLPEADRPAFEQRILAHPQFVRSR